MISFLKYISLLESKIDDLKVKYPDHVNAIDHIASIDHTPTKKYTQPLVKMHIQNNLANPQESSDRIRNTIRNFDAHGAKLEQKNFAAYKNLDDVDNALMSHVEKAAARKTVDKKAREEAPIVHEDNNISVREIKSHDASCKYGANTKWCVTEKNPTHYNEYSDLGKNKFFIIHDKKTNNKYAYHEAEDGIARNADDTQLSIDKLTHQYPQLNTVHALRNSKHGHKFITPQEKEQTNKLTVNSINKDLHPVHQAKIAKNSEFHDKLLSTFGKDLHSDVQTEIAKHPEHHDKLLSTFGKDLHISAQEEIVRHSKSHDNLLSTFGKNFDKFAQAEIARHQKSHSKLLSTFGKDLHHFAQAEIASHSKSHDILLSTFGKDLHSSAQAEIARYQKSHDKLLKTFGKDLSSSAQAEIVKYPESHDKLLSTFGKDLSSFAQEEIAKYPESHDKLLSIFGKDLHPDAQTQIARHPKSHNKILSRK